VVVEGYMDAIACQRAGVAAAAPLGTALTEEQMEALWRLHPEPTLCFDGDRAGRQAASRAIDRALPLLRPGKSFRFALVEGGKDPDEVLREQGPQALKAQLAQTTPFVEALFVRERDQEPLDTPERRAGLKARLRQAAGTIADKDLGQAYREALLERYDRLSGPPAPRPERAGGWTGRPRSGWRGGEPPLQPPTTEGMAAAKRLARQIEAAPAALARYAAADPPVLDDPLEDGFTASGFGQPQLAGLIREIIRLRLEAEHLDTEGLARHLASCGFSALLTDIDRAAASAGAPFNQEDVSLDARRSQWSHGFVALRRLAALEESIAAAKGDLARGGASTADLMRWKTERDTLKRAIRTGTIWRADGS
jgi:DNA primase